jgi:hypothetical protein
LHKAKAAKRSQRWSTAERAFLADAIASAANRARPGYAAIAGRMAETFGRAFTAASVGAQARKLGLVAKAAPKATKAPSKPRKARKAA